MSSTAVSGFVERALLDRDINADPYPYLTALREHAPVYWSRIHQSWLVTGYREVISCLQAKGISADRLSNVSDDEDVRRSFQVLSKWMAFNDSSEHRRLRSVFQEAFYRLQVQQYQPLAHRIVEQQLVQLREKGGHCDLVADFAQPISFTFFSQFLGVSPADNDSFHDWTARVGELILCMPTGAKGYRLSHESVVKLFHHFQLLIKQRQISPGDDDLISTVLEKGFGDVREEEFAAMLTHLSFAGAETTSNLITNGIRAILMDREQRKLLQDEPQHLQTAIDECLRFDGPLKVIIRKANSDFEIGGQTIKAGTRLYLLTAAANRDPLQFDHPNVFDIRRSPNAHLGFGHGPHSCLGSSLGHMLARVSVGSLLQEYPNLALNGDAHEWRLSIMGRCVKELLVRN